MGLIISPTHDLCLRIGDDVVIRFFKKPNVGGFALDITAPEDVRIERFYENEKGERFELERRGE